MAPEWWVEAQLAAEELHDPAAYDGREWDSLTDTEREEAINEHIYGMADAARLRKESV